MLSAGILREHAEADKKLVKQIVATTDTVFSECSPSLAQLFSIDCMLRTSLYAKHCSRSSTPCLRVVVHLQGTEFTLARVLIINNMHHTQCQSMLMN